MLISSHIPGSRHVDNAVSIYLGGEPLNNLIVRFINKNKTTTYYFVNRAMNSVILF